MGKTSSIFNKLFHYGQKASKNGWKFRRRVCKYLLRIIYQCEIDLAADIDETVEFCHNGFGIVVNARSKIGGELVYNIVSQLVIFILMDQYQ